MTDYIAYGILIIFYVFMVCPMIFDIGGYKDSVILGIVVNVALVVICAGAIAIIWAFYVVMGFK